ncbi:tail fiber protein [Psychrobacillus sp. NPDC093180]|uniref:tail fiber protein n=1 Tax=Psychrobacillus sp. NPDC093180 TaxID=3364489 RepID=UPI0038012F3E
MKLTTIFKFKKPDLTDYVNVEDLNENMDILDEALGTHLDKDASTTQKGHVQLSDATNSTSTILAATANAVKKVWDLATGKYSKPTAGIPKTDLDNAVQTSLGKADSALQSVSKASTTVEGIVMLDDAVDSNSTTKAATANAVKKVKESVSNVNNYGVATQAEAEAGTSDVKYMTPLKVKQSIKKNVPGVLEKISSIDFSQVTPATSINITNLNLYKKIRVIFTDIMLDRSTDLFRLTYNNITGPYDYGRWQIGVNPQSYGYLTINNGNNSVNGFNGELEIDALSPELESTLLFRTKLSNKVNNSFNLSFYSLARDTQRSLNSMQLSVNPFAGGTGKFTEGKIEVWGELK